MHTHTHTHMYIYIYIYMYVAQLVLGPERREKGIMGLAGEDCEAEALERLLRQLLDSLGNVY